MDIALVAGRLPMRDKHVDLRKMGRFALEYVLLECTVAFKLNREVEERVEEMRSESKINLKFTRRGRGERPKKARARELVRTSTRGQ